MPAIPPASIALQWVTILETIGAVTRSTIEASRRSPANQSHQPPQFQPQHHHFYPRDPGASDAKLGGGIVGGLTLGVLFFVVLCLRRRNMFSSPPPSPSLSPHHHHHHPPKISMGRLPITEEGEEPMFGFIRRKPPKAKLDSWHRPLYEGQEPGRHGMERAYAPPGAHRNAGEHDYVYPQG